MFGKKEMRILMVGLDAAGKVQEILEPLVRFNYYVSSDNYSLQTEAG